MILPDVNVLVYAHRRDSPRHEEYKRWLVEQLESGDTCGFSEIALSAVVRIVTHPKIFPNPTALQDVLKYCDELRSHSTSVMVMPGRNHWGIFESLCWSADAKGNMVSDAYLAALAIESGAEFITTDRDYARFPGLRWRHPLDPPRKR